MNLRKKPLFLIFFWFSFVIFGGNFPNENHIKITPIELLTKEQIIAVKVFHNYYKNPKDIDFIEGKINSIKTY